MQARKKRYKAAKARMKPDDSKAKPKRYGTLQLTTCCENVFQDETDMFFFSVISSGSVSSFNDEDYEVGENSDDEEQEDPGDYMKGTLCGVACKELLLQLRLLF